MSAANAAARAPMRIQPRLHQPALLRVSSALCAKRQRRHRAAAEPLLGHEVQAERAPLRRGAGAPAGGAADLIIGGLRRACPRRRARPATPAGRCPRRRRCRRSRRRARRDETSSQVDAERVVARAASGLRRAARTAPAARRAVLQHAAARRRSSAAPATALSPARIARAGDLAAAQHGARVWHSARISSSLWLM